MSHLFQSDRVKLICSCGLLRPITFLYFCRHCPILRCSNCVTHEVDTFYCPCCLENLPVNEARLKKNICATCFDCPSCQHTLSTRAISIQVPNPDESNSLITKKFYYLGCTNCRWTSRDVEMKDQIIATSGWPEKQNKYASNLEELMEHYRAVAQRDKFDAERKRTTRKKMSYLNVSDKFLSSSGFSSLGSKRSLVSMSTPFSSKVDTNLVNDKIASVASTDVEGLSPEIFTEDVNLAKVCTIEQRLQSPEYQPVLVKDLHPSHKHLIVKCSHRCRQCEHNLSKPEYNPSSIKFKIQLGAFYHVPEIRLVKEVHLKSGESNIIQLSVCNPTAHKITFFFFPFDIKEVSKLNVGKSSKSTSFGSQQKIVNLPKEKLPCDINSDIVLPEEKITIRGRDDTAEYGEVDCTDVSEDESSAVAWRRLNKIGVDVRITPKADAKEAIIGLILNFNHTNTVTINNEAKSVNISIPVIINAGVVS